MSARNSIATVEEARRLLDDLGFDREQTNDRAAYVLLSLLQLSPGDPWSQATNPLLGTRAIMDWVASEFHVEYKPNSRETIRRFTLHQFVEALLVERNSDDPLRAVNSPKNVYNIHPNALKLVRAWGTPGHAGRLEQYLDATPGLKDKYRAAREMNRIPITLPDGEPITLSPGGQNTLIRDMIQLYCPAFTPGGHVLYIGDADKKWAVFRQKELASLGVEIDQHGKMPDLVVYMRDRNWLVLMEAASSHGPVDSKRRHELRELFAGCSAGLVYVSCFPSRAEMRRFLADIAWETEVWCADNPTHLIHFNGVRFLGPYDS